MDKQLLNNTQMAQFVSDGFLRFDAVVPQDLCQASMQEMEEHSIPQTWGDSQHICTHAFNDAWQGFATKQVFDLPIVRGAIESLVGPEPILDHHAIHMVAAQQKRGANLHQDSLYDGREHAFDIQISFFPQAITPEMGGTLFVPGSHFHRPRLHPLGRYHHIKGQQQTVCPAGTIVVWHHNVWHSARSNKTDQTRYMFKLRLNPQHKQCRLWDCTGLEDFNPYGILNYDHGWFGDDHRHILMQRAKMWGHLTGNPNFDILGFWTRLRNEPQTMYSKASTLRVLQPA